MHTRSRGPPQKLVLRLDNREILRDNLVYTGQRRLKRPKPTTEENKHDSDDADDVYIRAEVIEVDDDDDDAPLGLSAQDRGDTDDADVPEDMDEYEENNE
jgi:hypothetical protein